ncbi:MAG TPA: hypothetical protein DEP24_00775 [Mycobacterium sp.]|nr:hypothetical protein [Mycobacterium sp.]
MGGMVGLWGASSMIRSVQYGTVAFGGADVSKTTTITSVDVNNSLLYPLENNEASTASNTTDGAWVGLSVTNATTITGTRSATNAVANTAGFVIVEYAPGVLKSVQRGVKTINGSGNPYSVTITAVDPAKAVFSFTGRTGDSNTFNGSFGYYGTLTNGTTATLTSTYNSGGLGFAAYWQVGEWF